MLHPLPLGMYLLVVLLFERLPLKVASSSKVVVAPYQSWTIDLLVLSVGHRPRDHWLFHPPLLDEVYCLLPWRPCRLPLAWCRFSCSP